MKAQEIRDKFTKFFTDLEHDKLESSSLVPQNDPTLLFANAGMNQFKDYFTGKATASNPKATTIQKCVRAGGKHNDLENVGFTARHHTFFEMCGNFSFGDYFKKEAIQYAWKFLTEELKIPKDKLYVTVHTSDQDAADIWMSQEGVPKERIFFLGDADNFWEMGDTGPCGPCSEIFYDHGEEYSDGADTTKCILNDEGRYVEIWNLVFMQYEKFKEGTEVKRRNLPKPSVDTGAGLERIAAAMQGVYWNYDSDVFSPILSAIEKLSGHKYSDKRYTSSMRVIADHIRSATMLITDGVMPASDGRGYVLRRIIRRAVRNMEELGVSESKFYQLVPSVFESLTGEYPQNQANASLAEKLLKIEEDKFRQTLKTGLDLIKKEIPNIENNLFPGELAFKLYDTYGFPFDLTEVILKERKIEVDTDGFEAAMEEQRISSRKTNKFAADNSNIEVFYKIKESIGETEFTGYKELSSKSKILHIEVIKDATYLFFDKTPFYGEGGGQAGDLGSVNGSINIIDTIKPVDGLFAHISTDDCSSLNVGDNASLVVSKNSRQQTTYHHSATHLLQAALIETLGDHVKQAGSSVSFDRLRFDFTHPEALNKKQIASIEKLVNLKIQEDLPVNASIMTKDEATQKGAMALFGEKYGDEVRVLEMGDFSIELCGGTHVNSTKEIGQFVISFETSLSSGVRRIEAFVSNSAFNYLNKRSKLLAQIELDFSVKGAEVLKKIESLQADLKTKTRQVKELKDKVQSAQGKSLFNNTKDIGKDFGLVSVHLKDGDPKEFRNLSDKFIDQNDKDVLLVYTEDSEKISYILRTHKKNKSINCSTVVKNAQSIVDGRGGGRPDMAQGSGSLGKTDLFLAEIENQLKAL
jgi:alanyl-tRNA synthetase